MHLPTWDDLASDDEQLDVLEAPLDESLFVAGPPGSGKTSLAAWRGDALADLYGTTPIVTYNRMLRRTLQAVSDASGIDIRASTMQSYVWRDYQGRTGDDPPRLQADAYAYDWGAMIERLEGTDPQHQALVVDEGQDLPEGFFRYASRFVAKTMSVFADDDQTIGRSRSTLEQIQGAASLPHPMILSENHRNTPEIARLAEHFHRGRLPAATVQRSRTSRLPRLIRSPSEESTAERIHNEFRTRQVSIGVVVDHNHIGKSIHQWLKERLPDSRVDRYSNCLRNEDEIDVRTPGITVLNKGSVKGQEFDSVFILELHRFIPCTNDAEYRAMYMMCSRARDSLTLVYGPAELSAAAQAALPGPDLLER